MTASHRATRFRLLPRLLAVLAALALLAVGVVVQVQGTVATAATRSYMKAGAGKWIDGNTFVGYYRALVGNAWVKVYCVSPTRRTPTRIGLATVSGLPSVSATVTREVAQTLSAHGNATTAGQAEAVSQAVNYEIGNRTAVAQRARHLSPGVQSLAMRYVAEARRYRGSYELQLHLGSSPLPGQTGRASISLRGPGGGRAATVRLSSTSNASVPASVRTDASGRASFTYRTTRGGEVHIAATASGLPPSTLRASAASRTTQRMLTWSPATSVRASAHYRAQVAGFTQRYECTTTCNGRPRVVLTACAPASGYPSAITYQHGKATHGLDFPASTTRACRTWTVRLHDGEVVTASWRFQTPQGWTAPVAAGGSFRVDCPPAPPVAVALSYDCKSAALSVVLGRQSEGRLAPLRNKTTHPMVLVIEGAQTGRFPLAPGATAVPHTFAVDCGEAATVDIRAGIQRSSGAYNYGGTTHITLP